MVILLGCSPVKLKAADLKIEQLLASIHQEIYRVPLDRSALKKIIQLCSQLNKKSRPLAELYLYQAIAEYKLGMYQKTMESVEKGKLLVKSQIHDLTKPENTLGKINLQNMLREFENLAELAKGRERQELYRWKLKKEFPSQPKNTP
jgi:predicted component of viral defense system (DUF524 family)